MSEELGHGEHWEYAIVREDGLHDALAGEPAPYLRTEVPVVRRRVSEWQQFDLHRAAGERQEQ